MFEPEGSSVVVQRQRSRRQYKQKTKNRVNTTPRERVIWAAEIRSIQYLIGFRPSIPIKTLSPFGLDDPDRNRSEMVNSFITPAY